MTPIQARKETLEKIKAMVAEGKTLKEALTANDCSVNAYYRWRATGRKVRAYRKKAVSAPKKLSQKAHMLLNGDFVQFILTNPKLDDAQRVKVLLAYTQG